MARGSISVTLAGQEFRIRRDGDDLDVEWLKEVARHVDSTMDRIRDRTGTVDTRELALLTALNLAREVLELRRRVGASLDDSRVRALFELAESALDGGAAADA